MTEIENWLSRPQNRGKCRKASFSKNNRTVQIDFNRDLNTKWCTSNAWSKEWISSACPKKDL